MIFFVYLLFIGLIFEKKDTIHFTKIKKNNGRKQIRAYLRN